MKYPTEKREKAINLIRLELLMLRNEALELQRKFDDDKRNIHERTLHLEEVAKYLETDLDAEITKFVLDECDLVDQNRDMIPE